MDIVNLRHVLSLPKYIKGEEIKSPEQLKVGTLVMIYDLQGKLAMSSVLTFEESNIDNTFTFYVKEALNHIDYLYSNGKWFLNLVNYLEERIIYKVIDLDE